MPAVSRIVLDLDADEQARLLTLLRRARHGRWLQIHILLLLAQHRSPSDIADGLLCSRDTVYAAASAWQSGYRPWHDDAARQDPALPAGLTPARLRSLHALLKKAPSAWGWCRQRWSCETLALSLPPCCGRVSAETVRRWLRALGWRWKRAKPVGKDNDPQRTLKLARIRLLWESLGLREALLFADELDLHLLPKTGYEWMENGTQTEVLTPGKNERRYLAGAWDVRTGEVQQVIWYKKQAGLFVDLLAQLDAAYPVSGYDKVYVVVDNFVIHKAKKVERWLAEHPRFELVFQPKYCPRANPIERIFGDLHDKVTRNHTRKQIWRLVKDVERHLATNGPWLYRRSTIYDTDEVTAAVEELKAKARPAA
jgi:hypothetical protein